MLTIALYYIRLLPIKSDANFPGRTCHRRPTLLFGRGSLPRVASALHFSVSHLANAQYFHKPNVATGGLLLVVLFFCKILSFLCFVNDCKMHYATETYVVCQDREFA